MHRTRIGAAISLVWSLLLAASCADRPTGPGEEIEPFAISDAQRANLAAALRFATRDEGLSELANRAAAARISMAAAELNGRVHANDRGGAQRAISRMRSELRSYRERDELDAGALLMIEALSLALDHAEMLAAVVPAEVYVADHN